MIVIIFDLYVTFQIIRYIFESNLLATTQLTKTGGVFTLGFILRDVLGVFTLGFISRDVLRVFTLGFISRDVLRVFT